MRRIALLLAVLTALPAASQEPPVPTAREELAKATAKTGALENYRFTGRIEVNGLGFIEGPMDLKGAFVKDTGFYADLDLTGPIYRVGKKVAMKDPATGDWVLAKAGRAVGEDQAALLGVAARGLKPPHEDLLRFEDRFDGSKLKKKDGKEKVGDRECAVFEGGLTEAGIKGLIPGGLGAFLAKGEFKGEGRVWVADDGQVVRYLAKASIRTDFNGEDLEFDLSRDVEIQDVGKAKVEVPDEVRRLFDATEEDEKKD